MDDCRPTCCWCHQLLLFLPQTPSSSFLPPARSPPPPRPTTSALTTRLCATSWACSCTSAARRAPRPCGWTGRCSCCREEERGEEEGGGPACVSEGQKRGAGWAVVGKVGEGVAAVGSGIVWIAWWGPGVQTAAGHCGLWACPRACSDSRQLVWELSCNAHHHLHPPSTRPPPALHPTSTPPPPHLHPTSTPPSLCAHRLGAHAGGSGPLPAQAGQVRRRRGRLPAGTGTGARLARHPGGTGVHGAAGGGAQGEEGGVGRGRACLCVCVSVGGGAGGAWRALCPHPPRSYTPHALSCFVEPTDPPPKRVNRPLTPPTQQLAVDHYHAALALRPDDPFTADMLRLALQVGGGAGGCAPAV